MSSRTCLAKGHLCGPRFGCVKDRVCLLRDNARRVRSWSSCISQLLVQICVIVAVSLQTLTADITLAARVPPRLHRFVTRLAVPWQTCKPTCMVAICSVLFNLSRQASCPLHGLVIARIRAHLCGSRSMSVVPFITAYVQYGTQCAHNTSAACVQ